MEAQAAYDVSVLAAAAPYAAEALAVEGYDLLDQVPDTSFDVALNAEANVDVQLGLQVDLELNLGSVDTELAYTLDTRAAYNALTDQLEITPVAVEDRTKTTVPFSTVSPSVSAYIAIPYEMTGGLSGGLDMQATVLGQSLFDTNGPATFNFERRVAGEAPIIDLDSTQALPDPLSIGLAGFGDISLAVPNVVTTGVATPYDPSKIEDGSAVEFVVRDQNNAPIDLDPDGSSGNDGDVVVGINPDELADAFRSLIEQPIQLGEEFKAFLDARAATADNFAEAVAFVLINAYELRTGEANTNRDGKVPLFVIDGASSQHGGLFNIELASADIVAPKTGGAFGFYAAEGSDEFFSFTLDVDQIAAAIVNLVLGNGTTRPNGSGRRPSSADEARSPERSTGAACLTHCRVACGHRRSSSFPPPMKRISEGAVAPART